MARMARVKSTYLAGVLAKMMSLLGAALAVHLAALRSVALAAPPKRPPTGYLLWLSETRVHIVKQLGTSNSRHVARRAGEMWRGLDPAVKRKYQKKYLKAWKKYKCDLEEYRDRGGEVPKAGRSMKKMMIEAPPRPLSAFVRYVTWMGKDIAASLPGDSIYDPDALSKAVEAKWKKLPASEKKPWIQGFEHRRTQPFHPQFTVRNINPYSPTLAEETPKYFNETAQFNDTLAYSRVY